MTKTNTNNKTNQEQNNTNNRTNQEQVNSNKNNHKTNQETRGGTHEQHVKAGEAGGNAPHVCRGNECKKH